MYQHRGFKIGVTLISPWVIVLIVALPSLTQTRQRAQLAVQTGHSSFAGSVAFSPDGKTLASGSEDRTIKIWEVETGRQLRSLAAHTAAVQSVAFSPDGKTLASASRDRTVKIWQVETGSLLNSIEGHTSVVWSVAFSPDGKKVASGGGDKTVKIWEVGTGQQIATMSAHTWIVSSVSFAPDGKTLASGSWDKTIKIWDVKSGKAIRSLEKHTGPVVSVAFSPDGKSLASASDNDSIRVWAYETGMEVGTLRDSAGSVECIRFSPDGKSLALGVRDATVRVLDVATGEQTRLIAGHTDQVLSVAFSPNGTTLASVSRDKTIRIWESATGRQLVSLDDHTAPVMSAVFSPDGKIIASVNMDRTIKMWDFETGRQVKSLGPYTDSILSIAFSPDGKTLASASWDRTVTLWELETGRQMRTFDAHSDQVWSLAFSPDGNTIASGSRDRTIKIWEIKTGRLIASFEGHASIVESLAFSPDGKTLASGSWDKTIKIWEVGTGRQIASLVGHTSMVESVEFSQDGKILTSGGWDRTVRIWHVESGRQIRSLNDHSDVVWSVAISPDSKTLASVSRDRTIRVWETQTGKQLRVFTDHTDQVVSVAFSPDGDVIASASWDATIRLWDLRSNRELSTLISLDKQDWVVTTPAGLFDASAGARNLLHYVIGFESFTLEQMKDTYYVPGLLSKIIERKPLPNVELFATTDLFPEVEFEQPKPGQQELPISLTDRGGGIGPVQVLINGIEYVADARPPGLDPKKKGRVRLTISLKDAQFLPGAENRIEVIARNISGSLTNRGTVQGARVFKAPGEPARETPNIYVIAVGISEYTGNSLNLNYAAKDAEDFALAVEAGAVRLLGGDKGKVHIRLLTSGGGKSGREFGVPDAKTSKATKSDIRQAFSDFRGATVNDVFIVYLAGHGVAVNLQKNETGGQTYFYLTQEAVNTDMTEGSVRDSQSLSSEEIRELMRQNSALKRVLILDTCAAGASAGSFVAKRDVPSDQIRALERLKDNTGFYVLMGSSANKVSYEASQFGQGLLTYALLQGMKGAKLKPNGEADVEDLFGYSKERVVELSKYIGGIQRPETITPDNSRSFPIGLFTAAERSSIKLSSPKPLILRPNLYNERLRRDDLQLTALLRAEIRRSTSMTVRGNEAPIVFIDADDMPDAIVPSGGYIVEGDDLTLTLVLSKNNEQVGKEIVVKGKLREKNAAIERLFHEILVRLR